jgi:hypothetical protein
MPSTGILVSFELGHLRGPRWKKLFDMSHASGQAFANENFSKCTLPNADLGLAAFSESSKLSLRPFPTL